MRRVAALLLVLCSLVGRARAGGRRARQSSPSTCATIFSTVCVGSLQT